MAGGGNLRGGGKFPVTPEAQNSKIPESANANVVFFNSPFPFKLELNYLKMETVNFITYLYKVCESELIRFTHFYLGR